MKINRILKNGRRLMKLDAAKRHRNRQLGIGLGAIPSWARKMKLSGYARIIRKPYTFGFFQP